MVWPPYIKVCVAGPDSPLMILWKEGPALPSWSRAPPRFATAYMYVTRKGIKNNRILNTFFSLYIYRPGGFSLFLQFSLPHTREKISTLVIVKYHCIFPSDIITIRRQMASDIKLLMSDMFDVQRLFPAFANVIYYITTSLKTPQKYGKLRKWGAKIRTARGLRVAKNIP